MVDYLWFYLALFGLANASGWYNEFFWWLGRRQVCFEGYGCFSTEYPFTNSEGFLPQSPDSLNVRLLLYTRQNKQTPLDITRNTVDNFDAEKEVKVIIHGYYNSIRSRWWTDMKNAFLRKADCNVIMLDWENAAGSLSYHQAVANTRIVAAITAKRLHYLLDHYNLNATSIHIVGFSLGAHLAGYIGSSIEDLGRITGLDPAGPNFENTDIAVRLDPSDAVFVDVIHTDADQLFNVDLSPGFGTLQAMGHADFYPNGGNDQPGCATNVNQHLLRILRGSFNPIENFGCSHLRALDLFTESINSDCKFVSHPCPLQMLETDNCNNCGDEGCNFMGYYAFKPNGNGTFLTNTRVASPYCPS